MAQYITWEDLAEHLGIKNASKTRPLDVACKGASEAAEYITGRIFYQAEEERELCVGPHGEIEVIDLVSISTLAVDQELDGSFSEDVEVSELQLLPRTQRNGRPAVRHDCIVPRSGTTAYGQLHRGLPALVGGVWGYYDLDEAEEPVAPSGVVQACLIVAAAVYKRKDTPSAVSAMPASGYRELMKSDKQAREYLADFIHPRLKRVVQ